MRNNNPYEMVYVPKCISFFKKFTRTIKDKKIDLIVEKMTFFKNVTLIMEVVTMS